MGNTHQSDSWAQVCREQEENIAEMNRIGEQTETPDTLLAIRRKILVLSAKGGVGKSTVAVNLAITLSHKGLKTGLLDTDLLAPSIPTLLGMEGKSPTQGNGKTNPVPFNDNLKVMSTGLLLHDDSERLALRGQAKHSLIKEFFTSVDWGELDYLVVDCPPGESDEPLSVIQLLQNVDGAVIVTTPQELSLVDVRTSITFCRHLKLPVIGIVENMSGHVCPHCGNNTDIFKSGGGKQLAFEMGTPFLGSIPLDPAMVAIGDNGKTFMEINRDTTAGSAMREIFEKVLAFTG